jgi:hypothetical protein
MYGTGDCGAVRGRESAQRLMNLLGGYLGYYNNYSAACLEYTAPFVTGVRDTNFIGHSDRVANVASNQLVCEVFLINQVLARLLFGATTNVNPTSPWSQAAASPWFLPSVMASREWNGDPGRSRTCGLRFGKCRIGSQSHSYQRVTFAWSARNWVQLRHPKQASRDANGIASCIERWRRGEPGIFVQVGCVSTGAHRGSCGRRRHHYDWRRKSLCFLFKCPGREE